MEKVVSSLKTQLRILILLFGYFFAFHCADSFQEIADILFLTEKAATLYYHFPAKKWPQLPCFYYRIELQGK